MSSSSDDLAPLLSELATTLEQLRGELDAEQPQQVSELLRFTEQYTIPTLIAVLEANIRFLKLTAGAIRLADGRLDENRRETVSAMATDTLDRTLADISGALRGDPTDPDARRLLEDARELRREIRTRVESPDNDYDIPVSEATRVPVSEEGDEPSDDQPAVDIEAELDSIRRELHPEESHETVTGDEQATEGDETDR